MPLRALNQADPKAKSKIFPEDPNNKYFQDDRFFAFDLSVTKAPESDEEKKMLYDDYRSLNECSDGAKNLRELAFAYLSKLDHEIKDSAQHESLIQAHNDVRPLVGKVVGWRQELGNMVADLGKISTAAESRYKILNLAAYARNFEMLKNRLGSQ